MADEPNKRFWHESAQIGDLIYLFGGSNENKRCPRSEIHVFDTQLCTWHPQVATGANIPPPCTEARCVVIDGFIYTYGGWTGDWSRLPADVYCLDVKEMAWESVDTSQGEEPKGRAGHCLCAVGSRVIMFGGYPCDDEKLYELSMVGRKKGVWLEVKLTGEGPGIRWGAAMAAINDHQALIHGGWNKNQGMDMDDCFVIDLDKKSWNSVKFDVQPSGRKYHTFCQLEKRDQKETNCFLLIGGENSSDHGYILDFAKRKTYKMESAEPICCHTSHCVEKEDRTIEVILLGGKDPLTSNVKSQVTTTIRIDPTSPDYMRIESAISSLQQSSGVKDQMIRQLEKEKVELSKKCYHLEAQVVKLNNEQELVANGRQAFERSLSECQFERQTLERSLSESREDLQKFLDVLCINPKDVELTDQKLGSGAFADVCIGRWHEMSVAVKKFHQLITNPRTILLFHQEVLVSSRLHHPNIVTVCGAVMEDGAPLQMIAELLEGSVSELIDAAHASGCYLTEYEQMSMAVETTSAIAYLHQLSPRPYVHSDIRPTNLLVTRDMKVKVGDLGAAHLLESSLSVGPLSPQYLAPERKDRVTSHSSLESDVYSLGVTMIEIFTGVGAIEGRIHSSLSGLIRRSQLHQQCSRMIADTASERPSARECLKSFATEKEPICPRLKRLARGKFKAGAHHVNISETFHLC